MFLQTRAQTGIPPTDIYSLSEINHCGAPIRVDRESSAARLHPSGLPAQFPLAQHRFFTSLSLLLNKARGHLLTTLMVPNKSLVVIIMRCPDFDDRPLA